MHFLPRPGGGSRRQGCAMVAAPGALSLRIYLCFAAQRRVRSYHQRHLCKRRVRAGGARPVGVVGPSSVSLNNVYLVALRRKRLALGVYEWLPQLEVRM